MKDEATFLYNNALKDLKPGDKWIHPDTGVEYIVANVPRILNDIWEPFGPKIVEDKESQKDGKGCND